MPSPPTAIAARARAVGAWFTLSRAEWRLLGLLLVLKCALFYFGLIVNEVYTEQHVFSLPGLLAIWNRWDSPNYLHIAQHGYLGSGKIRFNIAFFPGYPLLIAGGMALGMSPLVSAFVVSTIASGFVVVLLYRLARLDEEEDSAHRAVWFLLIFPTAYFLHVMMTESPFLAFTLGSFLAARRGRWPLAGFLGFCAAMTRINGCLLVPALAAEWFFQWRATRRPNWDWVFVPMPLLGLLLYLRLNWAVTGNPLMFLVYQRENWHHYPAPPWIGLWNALIFSIGSRPPDAQMIGSQEFIFGILALVFTVVCLVKLRLSYGLWTLLNWLLIYSTNFLTSTPRYVLVFFPIFLLWGRLTRSRFYFDVFTVCCLLFYGLFAAMYAQQRFWGF